ncbi:hypothetical protein FNF29_07972 [Cafeteria roenbergensis]|nr:hypothetical protein FNF29_07972 [Cafeteria roenbergensis]|eukprot:KAA0146565.1 hypothetical protein FNF29_07972 [Cafeteria roenbergensis]
MMLKGHERAITYLAFNADGDLLVSAAREPTIVLWSATTGERLGTYEGHVGAVQHVDLSPDSTLMLSASGDATVRLWEVETGVCKHIINLDPAPARCVAWSPDMTRFAVAADGFGASLFARVLVYKFPGADNMHELGEPICVIHNGPTEVDEEEDSTARKQRLREKASILAWLPPLEGYCDEETDGLLVGREGGTLTVYDPATGSKLDEPVYAHEDVVTSIRFNRDRTLFVTSSADKSVKLWDTRSLAELRVFNVDTMMNGCAISPIRPHVLMAGGQEARNVTTTAASAGRFETRIHHVVGGEELARIPGHFGTVNSIDVSPDGRSLATGGEDGYVRLNFLPPGYFRLGEDEDLRDPAVAVALEAFMHAAAEIVDDPTLPSVFDDEAATEEGFAAAEQAYDEAAAASIDTAAVAAAAAAASS